MFKITRVHEFILILEALGKGIQAEINEETRPMHTEALIQLRDACHDLREKVRFSTKVIEGKDIALAARLLRVAGFKLDAYGYEFH